MRYTTLLIDFDGTLFDTRNAIRKTLAELARRRGVAPFESEAIDEVIDLGLPLAAMLDALVLPNDTASLNTWIDDYRQIYNSGIGVIESAPYPGIEGVLRALHRRSAEMFVVSNKGEVSVLASLEHHHLRPYFRDVIGSRGALPTKPESASFVERVLPLMHATDVEEVLVVGDTEIDITYARNIGASSCWAAYGYGRPDSCEALTPHFVMRNPDDLLRYVFD
jgi:phosphoglycolate phosphatase